MKSKNKTGFIPGEFYDAAIAMLPITERRDVMEGLAYKVITEGYTKHLTPSELADKKSELAEISIRLAELEEEKKFLIAEMKNKMQEPTVIKGELLSAIKHKSEFRKGLLYYIDDQDAGMMYIFDDNAECVESRALRQEEKQTVIKQIFKTGTNE